MENKNEVIVKDNEQMDILAIAGKELSDFGGFEDLDASTMSIPFIRVAQANSPELSKQDTKYIKGLETGYIFNTVTKEVFGESLLFTPIKFEHVRMEWKQDRGGYVGVHRVEDAMKIAVDALDASGRLNYLDWHTPEGNILSDTYNYYIVIYDKEEKVKPQLVILSLSATMLKEGRKMNTSMANMRLPNGQPVAPRFQMWKAISTFNKNDSGSWYTLAFNFHGFIKKASFSVVEEQNKFCSKLDSSAIKFENSSDATKEDESKGDGSFKKDERF